MSLMIHSHFENPFGVPPRGRPFVERNEPRLDYNFKVEIPEFRGSLKPEDFVDWLNTVERVFDYYEVMDEKKVKLIAICLSLVGTIANFSPKKWQSQDQELGEDKEKAP